MNRTERRYRHAVDVTILVLAVTFVGLACGLLFAPDWLFANARWVFGALAFGWAASFSWLLTAAAWSVKGLPARDIGDPEPADEGTPPPVAEPVAPPAVAVNGDRPAPAQRGATR